MRTTRPLCTPGSTHAATVSGSCSGHLADLDEQVGGILAGLTICSGAQGSSGPENRTAELSRLTAREAEVLLLLADGQPNRTLARRLGIAERTLRAHITSLTRKLGIGSRLEAALFADRHRNSVTQGETGSADTRPTVSQDSRSAD
ncbi:LuxR C-terminal-related transcriptional regulator [Streptomyces sp. NBC_01410]|uniref:response regulator transcription factor n=1 Tax=Streptomyces sp. NBC_01410 TaxID=2903856 RepID=UPI003243F515